MPKNSFRYTVVIVIISLICVHVRPMKLFSFIFCKSSSDQTMGPRKKRQKPVPKHKQKAKDIIESKQTSLASSMHSELETLHPTSPVKSSRTKKSDVISQMQKIKQMKGKKGHAKPIELVIEPKILPRPQNAAQDLEDSLMQGKVVAAKSKANIEPDYFAFEESLAKQKRDQEPMEILKAHTTLIEIEDQLDVAQKLARITQSDLARNTMDDSMVTESNISNVASKFTNLSAEMQNAVQSLVQAQLQESRAQQNLVAESMEKFFENLSLRTRRQRNCVFFQEMMKAMPSQKKTWRRKIKNFFSAKKVNNLKSYRTLAIEMVLNLEVAPDELKTLQELIEEYRISKAMYYSKYMVGWSANLDVEVDERKALGQLIAKQAQVVQALAEEQARLEQAYQANLDELQQLAEQMQSQDIGTFVNEKAQYAKMVKTVQDSEKAIPLESLGVFTGGSTVHRMIRNFNEASDKFWKWSFIANSLKNHFQNKKKDRRAQYSVASNKAELAKINKRVEEIKAFFKKKSETTRTKLIAYLQDYVTYLADNQIKSNQQYQRYGELIFETAELETRLEDARNAHTSEKMRLEEARFKEQKLDFHDNFDYVFPSDLILQLQKKLKEISVLIENFRDNRNYFSLDDSEEYLSRSEELRFDKFFRNEVEDVMVTQQRVRDQLQIALEIDEIEGKIDFFLGKMLGKTQKVEKNKNCFALPEISYFVFLLLKTNVIAKQTKFFDGLFAHSEQAFAKEFIVFNYTLFAPTDYVQDLLERNRQAELAGNSDTFQDIFAKDFTLNFTIMINFYKDMTEFGTASTGVVKRSWGFAKNMLNLMLTAMNGQLVNLEEKGMEYLVDYITEAITGALSFLTVIPMAEDMVSGLVESIITILFEYISVFFQGAYQYFHRAHEEDLKEQLEQKKRADFFLDFDKEIEKLLEVKVEKKSASFNQNDTMQIVEGKYLDSMVSTGSIFNKLQNLNIFRDKDYQKKALKIFEQTNKIMV